MTQVVRKSLGGGYVIGRSLSLWSKGQTHIPVHLVVHVHVVRSILAHTAAWTLVVVSDTGLVTVGRSLNGLVGCGHNGLRGSIV